METKHLYTPWYITGTYCSWSPTMSELDKCLIKYPRNPEAPEEYIWYIQGRKITGTEK